MDTAIITAEERVAVTVTPKTSLQLATTYNRLLLLFLEQINRPKIGNFIVPHDQSPPTIIILVGPPASRRKIVARDFVASNER